jgi:hypothetical protein
MLRGFVEVLVVKREAEEEWGRRGTPPMDS